MASIERTAYPYFHNQLTEQELENCYELSDPERRFVQLNANGASQRLTLMVMLKTRQHLGYFPMLKHVPEQILDHLIKQFGFSLPPPLLDEDKLKKTLHRYRKAIRTYLNSKLFYAQEGRKCVQTAVRRAAYTMSDPADLINVAIEILVKENFELPAFSALDRMAGHIRQKVHQELYNKITSKLSAQQRRSLNTLLEIRSGESQTDFNRLKQAPGTPTLKHMRCWAGRLAWLDSILDPKPFFEGIAHTKIRQFAAEAEALEVGDMRKIQQPGKQYTFLLCLLYHAQVRTRDNLIEMFLRRMQRLHATAEEQLHVLQEKHRVIEEEMITVLAEVLDQENGECSDKVLGQRVRQVLAAHGGVDTLKMQYEKVSAYHHNNYFPLLWPIHARNRATLFRLLDLLQIESATQDTTLLEALAFIRRHRHTRRDYLPHEIALDFATQRWQAFVQKKVRTNKEESLLNRRSLEICVFTYIAKALRSGDLYVVESEAYDDYRKQLLPWEQCQTRLANYCNALDIPNNGHPFVTQLREQLMEFAQKVDSSFPDNTELSIDDNGIPHLKKQGALRLPDGFAAFEETVRSRMPERHLLDILKNVQYWTGYSRHFGPPSGTDPKLAEAIKKYMFTVFGYGCNLGASQTERHAPTDINRHTLRRINAQHITTTKLEAALCDIIAEFVRFELPQFWGSGNVAIADGTHIALRENNLLGERHIRYGEYGGIAYHHISDMYIALFSHFIACGVWEAVYILDGLLKNTSALQPNTVHADTHGQSEPVFGLAKLLGIKLFPRMRTWNDVIFYRVDKQTTYKHIDALFTQVVDWSLIERHWQDMMQVVLSIQAGNVLPSMLLRKLGSHNRTNKLYRAFRELGRVERTLFLLRYISEPEFRFTIRSETTKIESHNSFLDWISFGGPMLKTGDPVEQEKQIKYTNLIANAVMLHNVIDLTEVLNTMTTEGYVVTSELLRRLSPCMTRHLRRFGQYTLDMEARPDPLVLNPLQFTNNENLK